MSEANNTGTQPQSTAAPQAPAAPATPPAQTTGLDWVPETYRNDPSISKYKSQDEFFKGFQNLSKMVGQKQIVNGIQLPGENATEEDVNNFYKSIGRPESADKYTLPDQLEVPEGYDLNGTKENFTKLAHKNGLSQKQAEGLFKDFIEHEKQSFIKSNEQAAQDLTSALNEAFGEKGQEGFGLAKRGAKALGVGDKLDQAGLSTNPIVLQLCAKIGELTKEESFTPPKDGGSSKESLIQEALEIQRSDAYIAGDKVLHEKVQKIYKQVHG